MPTTFATVVGLGCWLISSRAVAQTVPIFPTGPALFAMDHACGGGGDGTFSWGGDGIIVHGDVISNGGIDYNSAGGSVDPGKTFTFYDPPPLYPLDNNCKYANHGNPAPNQAVGVPTYKADPFTYTTADFHCSFAPPLPSKLILTDLVIPSGTYCASTSIQLKQAGASCAACTFIAPSVSVSAVNVTLRPNEHGALMWGTGPGNAIQYQGAGADWAGIMYAPNGLAQISGKDGESISGAIWAKTIDISGSGWQITPPAAPAGSQGVVKLVE